MKLPSLWYTYTLNTPLLHILSLHCLFAYPCPTHVASVFNVQIFDGSILEFIFIWKTKIKYADGLKLKLPRCSLVFKRISSKLKNLGFGRRKIERFFCWNPPGWLWLHIFNPIGAGGGWISLHYFQTSISPWKKSSGGPKFRDFL